MAGRSNEMWGQLEEDISGAVGKNAAQKYLRLAKKFATKRMTLTVFDKKANGLVPVDLHSKIVLNIAEIMDMSFSEAKGDKSTVDLSADQIYYQLVAKGLAGVVFSKEDARNTVSELITYAQLVDSDVTTNNSGFAFLEPLRVRRDVTMKDVVKAVLKFDWLLTGDMACDFHSIFG